MKSTKITQTPVTQPYLKMTPPPVKWLPSAPQVIKDQPVRAECLSVRIEYHG